MTSPILLTGGTGTLGRHVAPLLRDAGHDVGADRVPVVGRLDRAMFGYYASKLAAERVVAGSGAGERSG